ncbi:MAG: xanthine dehydrogenase family protein molybdopterin-binding subunit [Candidatus Eiseniibacteriota bacterium]
MPLPLIGQSPTRTDGEAKVTGRALYVDDLPFEGLWHGRTVRSPIARGRLRGLEFRPGVPWNEIVVVTAADIPGKNVITLIESDQPCLAVGEIRHAAEPVALIAHPDRGLVAKAATLIELDIEPVPGVFDVESSLASSPQYGTDNVFKRISVARGDAKAAMARAPVVVEGTYRTGAQEQLYIEPQGMVALASPETGVTVWGSMQCPYYVHKALGPLFGLAPDKVRVIQSVTGGGFGGKEEYPNLIAGHAALLAWKAGHPVKLVYDRLEDMWATTKRHPSVTRIRSGFERDGRLVALAIDFTLDGGAYVTLSPVVLSRGTLHAAGAYRCDDVAIESRAVFTNSPPYGAFRGFGAPQSLFAIEMHMEKSARALGLDPIELRRRNFLRAGDTLPTGQVLAEDPGLSALLDHALTESGWTRKRAERKPRRGLGVSTFLHGSGFTGSGEVKLRSRAAVEIDSEARVRVLAASTDIGQGTITIFAQIVADRLGVALADVDVVPPDTARVPDSGPTVASRTVMVVGGLLDRASADLLESLRERGFLKRGAHTAEEFHVAARAAVSAGGPLRVEREYEPPPGIHWDDATYTGDAYAAYAWSVHVADVEVDPVTYQAEVRDFVAVQEVGRVLHPTLAAGQIEGGVAQGIGWALYEDVVLENGIMVNHQLTNYIVPTAADAPPIRVYFHEKPYAHGPGGAKGLGELPMDGPAPAIGAAIADALGVVVPEIPFVPERLLAATEEAR